MKDSPENKNGNDIRDFFKKWPSFYYFVMVVFGPVLFLGLNPKKFLRKFEKEGDVLNVGSGPRRIDKNVINVDMYKYEGVDVVADISNLPFESNSVGKIICDNVLEHVKNPEKVAEEIYRVLDHGGYVYISTPFIYPYHSSPSDFTRWTKEGLENLFDDFEIVESGVRSGPMSALNVWLCYIFATLFSFGNEKLYWFLVNLSIFIFFPIKFLDIIFNYWPKAINMSATIYCVFKKK